MIVRHAAHFLSPHHFLQIVFVIVCKVPLPFTLFAVRLHLKWTTTTSGSACAISSDQWILCLQKLWHKKDTKQIFCFHVAQTYKHLLRTQNVSEKKIRTFCSLTCLFDTLTSSTRITSGVPERKSPRNLSKRREGPPHFQFVTQTGKHLCPQQCVLVSQGLNEKNRETDTRAA